MAAYGAWEFLSNYKPSPEDARLPAAEKPGRSKRTRNKPMSKLLVKPTGHSGRVSHVTPESAGWTYVGFDLHRLKPGENVSAETGEREVCLVFVTGKGKARPAARISARSASARRPSRASRGRSMCRRARTGR